MPFSLLTSTLTSPSALILPLIPTVPIKPASFTAAPCTATLICEPAFALDSVPFTLVKSNPNTPSELPVLPDCRPFASTSTFKTALVSKLKPLSSLS